MTHLIAVLVFIFVSNYATSDAIALQCSFYIESYSVVGSLYSCVGRALIDDDDTVSAVFGTHLSGKRNLDVEGIYFESQNLPFFPRNMEEFFPNLLAIYLSDSSITNITNSHLIPFPNLRYLNLYRNKISTLDSNVFSGMWTSSASYYIDFIYNNIEHVGHDINLPNSGTIYFGANTCISAAAYKPDEISLLKLNLLRNCPPTISQIEESLESRPNLLTQLENRSTELETRSTQLENRSTQLETRVAFLEAKIESKLGLKIETVISEN